MYGKSSKGYYIYCDNCPISTSDKCPDVCNGYDKAWEAIQKYLNEQPTQCDDAVNHPSHYTRGKIEVADFIADQRLNFDRGNAVKYICRAGFKNNEIEDLEKAIWYLNHELKMLKGCDCDGKHYIVDTSN